MESGVDDVSSLRLKVNLMNSIIQALKLIEQHFFWIFIYHLSPQSRMDGANANHTPENMA
jgi:hypothetical protein